MLKAIGEGLWVAESEIKLPAGMSMPIRSTIIALDATQLMVISPLKPTPQLVQDIQDIGTVKYIVAPNCMHHLYVNKFFANFPEAEIWGPVDLQSKRPDIQLTGFLDVEEALPWDPYVEMFCLKARPPLFEEFIFFHTKSKTLVVTDMMFNFHNFNNWLVAAIAKLNGGYKKLAMTRLGKRYFNQPESLKKSAEKILAWKPENLVVAHGEVIVGGASQALETALAKML